MAFGDLTTLADVKAWLQTGANAFPATDDALLTRLIAAASGFIQTWLDREIAVSDWVEVRDGSGGQRLAFANVPVTAVLSLTIDGLTIPPAPGNSCGAGYLFTPTELALRGYVFTRRPQNVVVTYTAGYAATPPEIAHACIELVCQRYRDRTRIGETAKTLAGDTVRFSPLDMSDAIRAALLPYRRNAPAGIARRLAAENGNPATVLGSV